MKQIWPNYSYSPTTNVLTLTGLNIDRDQLLLVSAPERGRIMYNFADSTVTASAFTAGANTGLTLVASTAGLTTTAALVIYYDDQLQSTAITVSSLPAISGTVTIGGGTVTIGAGTAQIGSVTAGLSNAVSPSLPSNYTGDPYPAGTKIIPVGGWTSEIDGAHWQALSISESGMLYAELAQGYNHIGSVTASLAISSTTITSGSFTSLTSATLVPGNVARKMATVFNQGAGQLFVNAGTTATTAAGGFMVALSSGDFYECDYTTTTLSAIFATAGTASWVSH